MNETNVVKGILIGLERSVRSLTHCNPITDGVFEAAVRAALAKNYEVNCFVAEQVTETGAFAFTAALRGLCEDIICLQYILAFPDDDRNEIVKYILWRDSGRYMDKQRAFFQAYQPGQPILPTRDMKENEEEAKARLAELGYKTPNIETMAQKTGLLPLYEYLYVATSAYVHFSPHNLMRMGWETEKHSGDMAYSIQNFSRYYFNFNRFYAVLLFVVFCTRFADFLKSKHLLKPDVDRLIEILQDEIRWPELVTFEEMNRPAVSSALYVLGADYCKANRDEIAVLWKWANT